MEDIHSGEWRVNSVVSRGLNNSPIAPPPHPQEGHSIRYVGRGWRAVPSQSHGPCEDHPTSRGNQATPQVRDGYIVWIVRPTSISGLYVPPRPVGCMAHLDQWVVRPTLISGSYVPPRPVGCMSHLDQWVVCPTSTSGLYGPP